MNTPWVLDTISENNLLGVHPHLVAIVRAATGVCPIRFRVTEGLRTLKRQQQLVAQGASRTLKSRHLTGHAVDLAAMIDVDGDGDFEVRWDWPLYTQLAQAMKAAAKDLNTPIEWGGDWKTFRDGPHFQLPWRNYP